jgi:demethylmenaquinone methyltransferase / 2-methoxy-6-polyprenyl-1,4-benzoquinol methylase
LTDRTREPTPPLPAGEEKAKAVRGMFDKISPRYDLVNRVMTFGLDEGWRRRTVKELRLPGGSLVLDLACGTGDLCRELMSLGYRAVGFDFSMGMLVAAKTDAPLVCADVLRLPVAEGSADGITCGFALRNVSSLPALFAELGRVLRPGGRISLLDVSEPSNPVLRTGNSIYFKRVVPLIGSVLSDREAYSYLPRSVAYLPEPGELVEMVRSAGFADAVRHQLSGGLTQLIVGTRS